MRLVWLNKVKVLKTYDDWKIRSQHLEMSVPSIIMMNDQTRWKKDLKYSRSNIYLRDSFTCQLQITNKCKELSGKVKISELTLDHVVPKSLGGKSTWTNVCTSCKSCNGEKGNDKSIVPGVTPHKPTYYEILSKRRQFPIHIHDAEWLFYINWADDLVKILPQPTGYAEK